MPLLVSWPAALPADVRREELACLTDLFAVATGAAGALQERDGRDLLGMLAGRAAPRERLVGIYGEPGTPRCKVMVREGRWKFIYLANGGREQLFDLEADPHERTNRAGDRGDVAGRLRAAAASCAQRGAADALDGSDLRAFPYAARERRRIHQFDRSRGVTGFPERPGDVLRQALR